MARVAILFERSNTMLRAFRRIGIEAFSYDICPDYTGNSPYHVIKDLSFLANLADLDELRERSNLADLDELLDYDLIIAHPPCTYLSSVGASRLFNKDGTIKDHNREVEGFKAAQLVRGILNMPVDRLMLENPAPMSYFGLPPYSQVIQPYQFGEPYKKRTCLWLKGLPRLKPTNIVEPLESWVAVKRTSTERSKTFDGIAKAVAEQYGGIL